MALSMDEQRALAEIERRLAADDPGLATCLTAFRRPGPANVLRSPRVRVIGSLFTVLLVAMVSLMVYAMIPFRGHVTRTSEVPSSAPPANAAITAGSSGGPQSLLSASANASAAAAAKSPAKSAAPSAGQNASSGRTQPPAGQAADHGTLPTSP